LRSGIVVVGALSTIAACVFTLGAGRSDGSPPTLTPAQEAFRRFDRSEFSATYELIIESAIDPCRGTLIWHFDGNERQIMEEHCHVDGGDDRVNVRVIRDGMQIDCSPDRRRCEETGIKLTPWSKLGDEMASAPSIKRVINGETVRCFGTRERHLCFAEDGPLLGWVLMDDSTRWTITATSVERSIDGVSFDPPFDVEPLPERDSD
jgi:hypothetical protein